MGGFALNKKKNIPYIRLIIQLLFLIMMPGLFTLIFGQLKQIYTASISGNFELGRILPMSIEILILIPLTIVFGRFFCGYICAFGTINDLIYKFSSNVLKIKFKINKRADKFLKLIKYAVLLFIVIFIWTLGNNGLNGLNPWDAFAQIIQFPPSVPSITALCVLILILIGALFIERFFCRYLCPLGAFLSLIQALRIVRIKKNRSYCLNGCNLCSRRCSMGIDLEKTDRVDSIECIQCMNCTAGCLGNNAKATIKSKAVNELAVILIFIFTFTAFRGIAVNIIDNSIGKVGNTKTETVQNMQTGTGIKEQGFTGHGHGDYGEIQQKESVNVADGEYKNGKYTGTANGFKPGLTVEVTISGGKITNIDIVDDNETPRYASMPMQVIPEEIIKSQSTNVDTVSGATRTSVGIINAVADALKQAKK